MNNNRLGCYSYFLCLAGTVSLLILSQFLYSKFPRLNLMSRCRLTSLLIQHLFFFFMVYRLNKIDSSLQSIVEWLLQISGGMFCISTIAYALGYSKSPHIVRQFRFIDIELDPIDRVGSILWNNFFTEIWVYSGIVFFSLLFVIVLVKVKDWNQKRKRERAFEELIGVEKYYGDKHPDEKSCSICLMDYEEGEEISKTPCNHIFHPPCLLGWIQENFTCPLCRAEILV